MVSSGFNIEYGSLILKIRINCIDTFPQLRYAFKHLPNSADKFVKLYNNSAENRANKTLAGTQKLGRCVVAMSNPHSAFFDTILFQKIVVLFTKTWLCQKTYTYF